MVCPFCYGWNEADAAECLHCGRSLTSTPEDRRRRKAETASEPLILPEESPARRSTPSAVLVAVGIAAVLICAAVLALPRLVHRNRAPRAPHIVSQPAAQPALPAPGWSAPSAPRGAPSAGTPWTSPSAATGLEPQPNTTAEEAPYVSAPYGEALPDGTVLPADYERAFGQLRYEQFRAEEEYAKSVGALARQQEETQRRQATELAQLEEQRRRTEQAYQDRIAQLEAQQQAMRTEYGRTLSDVQAQQAAQQEQSEREVAELKREQIDAATRYQIAADRMRREQESLRTAQAKLVADHAAQVADLEKRQSDLEKQLNEARAPSAQTTRTGPPAAG